MPPGGPHLLRHDEMHPHAALHRLLHAMSLIGRTPEGGVHRPEGSEANREIRQLLVNWLNANDYTVRIDAVGNIFGIAETAGPNAPLIMTGSHVDSQPYGGRLDGAYGVAASCIAVETLRNELASAGAEARCNLCIVAWTNEEGARFQPSTLGSSVYAGLIDAEWALQRRDVDGTTVREALTSIGFLGKDVPPPMPEAFVELHVECGSTLEASNRRIGSFVGWWGVHKIDLKIVGAAAHTGPTPMRERRDALYAASLIIAEVRHLVDQFEEGRIHTSVGQIEVIPNSPNVVPAQAELRIEIRSGQLEVIREAVERLRQAVDKICIKTGTTAQTIRDELREPGRFSSRLIGLAQDTASEHGEDLLLLETICGHDAIRLAQHCDAIVTVVPSIEGICHSPFENTNPEDLELGMDLLTSMLRRLVVA